MKKRYTLEERPDCLSNIKAGPGVGNIRFDPDARDDDGNIAIGDNWIILVAPRPIPGTVSWTDSDTFPMFWSAIDPTSDFGPGHWKCCEELDAAEVIYVTEKVVKKTVQAYYDDKMPGRIDVEQHDIRDIFKSFLRIKHKEI